MTALPSTDREGVWDRLGCWASSACAVHCLASPFVFLALPAFGEVWAHPASHALMALVVVPLALSVLVSGYRRHQLRWVLGAAVLGIACILVGSALPYVHPEHAAATGAAVCDACCPTVATDAAGGTHMHVPPAAIATVIGSVFLIAAHLGNRLGCRDCDDGACTAEFRSVTV